MTERYGIFSGSFEEEEATWLGSVDGFEAAYNRMKRIAIDAPGRYFVFSPDFEEPLVSIDTTNRNWVTVTT
jgi:hypothetical protein